LWTGQWAASGYDVICPEFLKCLGSQDLHCLPIFSQDDVRTLNHKYVSVSVCLCQSVCLSECMSVCLSVCLSECMSVCLSVLVYVCLYVCLCRCIQDEASFRAAELEKLQKTLNMSASDVDDVIGACEFIYQQVYCNTCCH